MEYSSRKYIKNLLKPRAKNTHKGDYGKVLIVAGSKGMVGAAVLAARGALRAGAGLVRVSVDEELFSIVQGGVLEATCIPRDLNEDILSEYDSIVVGPGIGTDESGYFAVTRVMQNYSGPVVMDADALNIIGENSMDLRKTDAQIIITPHPGEAARLINQTTNEVNSAREKAVTYLVNSTNTVTVLKGNSTIIGIPGSDQIDMDSEVLAKLFINTTGNPGMATGGSGDVLSGIIGSFLGQGMTLSDAAVAGVYVHGHAGDLAINKYGEYGLTASDIAEFAAFAIKDIQEK